jgi:hypothetical protein
MKAKKRTSKALDSLGFSAESREATVSDADTSILRAAECAVRLDFDLNTFMQAAHSAYMHASPSTRDRLEAVQMQAHFDDLRRRGVLATA